MEQTMSTTGRNVIGFSGFLRSRAGLVLLAFVAIAAFFLWTEHRAHVLGALPWVLLAACPLLHLFMHRSGHGGNRDQKKEGGAR
jgi:Protein of unknown function (DUF2933)